MVERRVYLRDSTLREGLDVPGVVFSPEQGLQLAKLLWQCQVDEIEVLAPAKVDQDLPFARALKDRHPMIPTSGLLYAKHPELGRQIKNTVEVLNYVDLLIPLSTLRSPARPAEKMKLAGHAIEVALNLRDTAGIGFPNAMQADFSFLCEIACWACEKGARRITVYDTNGAANPFRIFETIAQLVECLSVPVYFHGHNDLGLATANSLAAVRAGAAGIDVTVNGLGDRAGNCALEQLAICLALENVSSRVDLGLLTRLADKVSEFSKIPIAPLAPVCGAFAFTHKSAGHFEAITLFEAYDPALIGRQRELVKS